MTIKDEALEQALEALVDQVGLRRVIDTLSSVCDAKSFHVACQWQDDYLSHVWGNAGDALASLSRTSAIRRVP